MPPMSPTEHASHHAGGMEGKQMPNQGADHGSVSDSTDGSGNAKENVPAVNAAPIATSNIPTTSPRITPSAEPKAGSDVPSQ